MRLVIGGPWLMLRGPGRSTLGGEVYIVWRCDSVRLAPVWSINVSDKAITWQRSVQLFDSSMKSLICLTTLHVLTGMAPQPSDNSAARFEAVGREFSYRSMMIARASPML